MNTDTTIESYFSTLVGRSPNTLALYRTTLRSFLTEAPAPPWTEQDVLLHLNLLSQRNARSSVFTKSLIIHKFLQWAATCGYCDANVPACAKMHKPPANAPRSATFEEMQVLLMACKRPKLRLALLLAGHLGLRESEIRGLRWTDVDLDQEQAAVFGKGSKWRTLPITSQALLHELRDQQGEPLQYVVPGRGGKMLSRGVFAESLKALCTKAGIRELNPHSLRHSFAAQSHGQGVPTMVVSRMLGHSSLLTTERYLSGLTGVDAMREGMKKTIAAGAP